MPNRIDINHTHSRAIVKESGERLRAFLQEEPAPPESLRTQIDRLRELEEQSPSIIPAAERCPSVAIEPLWITQTARPNMDEQCHR